MKTFHNFVQICIKAGVFIFSTQPVLPEFCRLTISALSLLLAHPHLMASFLSPILVTGGLAFLGFTVI